MGKKGHPLFLSNLFSVDLCIVVVWFACQSDLINRTKNKGCIPLTFCHRVWSFSSPPSRAVLQLTFSNVSRQGSTCSVSCSATWLSRL